MLNEDLENYTQLESRMQLRKIMIEKLYCMLYSESFKLPHNKHLKNINLVAHFLLLTFFDKINFQITLFPKMMPNFLHLPITPILKMQWFPLGMFESKAKIFLILYPPFENSTTRIAIL